MRHRHFHPSAGSSACTDGGYTARACGNSGGDPKAHRVFRIADERSEA
jgi:hypothetical protein